LRRSEKLNKITEEEFKEWITTKWGSSKLPIGGIVPKAATSLAFKTGEWRVEIPILDDEKCTGCTHCFFICPDDSIRIIPEKGYHPEFIYDFCKGCSLCAEICPTHAIKMILEEK
jgi:2-oxoacid:acceptor oxidoreductase delta subunit (pyruvate/2-ketoisovalerate family)